MSMLQLNQVSRTYQGEINYEALSGINISIEKGEFVGIMGPSGSGKTTLLNLISTVDAPTSGDVFIDGKQPHTLTKNQLSLFRRRELGFVFQSFNLLNTLTVKENIMLPLTLDGVSVKTMEQKVEEVAERLSITSILSKRTYEISGGQAQRTAIARGIIHKPKLLLLDEPTGNLDSQVAKEVLETLENINKEDNSTMLMVTHDAVSASYCNKVIFIKDGKLINELHFSDNRQIFFERIINMISTLAGHNSPSLRREYNN